MYLLLFFYYQCLIYEVFTTKLSELQIDTKPTLYGLVISVVAFITRFSTSVASFSWPNLARTLADKSEPFSPSNTQLFFRSTRF